MRWTIALIICVLHYVDSVPMHINEEHAIHVSDFKADNTEMFRLKRSDDDYEDEGGFVPAGKKDPDHDFIVNVQDCASGYARSPWGRCITCREYKRKLRVIGPGC